MSVFNINISIDGKPMAETAIITRLDVIREANKIGYAQLIIKDGDPAIRKFEMSEMDDFMPGKKIEIKLGYTGDPDSESTVFKGLIVKNGIEADIHGGFLEVTIKHPAIKMTGKRKKAVFSDLTDTDLFQLLIKNNGIETGTIAATETQHPELVQFWCTDWDMLLSRADLYGFWVMTKNGSVDILDPANLDRETVHHHYEYGKDPIISLKFEANAEEQYGKIVSSGWNIQDQVLTEGDDAVDFNPNPGDLNPEYMAEVTGGKDLELNSTVPVALSELNSWANGKMRKSRLGMIRGRLCIPGNALIKPGEIVELKGLNSHFNGKAIISGIRHRMTTGGWFTDIQFGMDPQSFVSRHQVMDQPASGIIPGIQGLHLGIVEEFEADPLEELRVKVKIPALGEEHNQVWARLVCPEAGTGRGYFFRPEPGDEVVLGFLNSDPRHPIILGSLYSSVLNPPEQIGIINEDNFIKGIYTRTGMKISFDDENQIIELSTSDNQHVTVNEKEKFIHIKGANDNSMLLNNNGITLTSTGDLNIEASGKIIIKGSGVDIQ